MAWIGARVSGLLFWVYFDDTTPRSGPRESVPSQNGLLYVTTRAYALFCVFYIVLRFDVCGALRPTAEYVDSTPYKVHAADSAHDKRLE